MDMEASRKSSYWSTYAAVYDEGVDYVVGRALRLAVAARLSHERHPGAVLECGCGTGFYTKAIAGHADHVTATDISEEMLDIAGHELALLGNVSFQKVNAEKTPFASGVFNTALLANILITVKNPLKILHECLRVLKYGGLLVVIAYTDYGMDNAEKMDLSLRYFQKFGMPPPGGLHNFSPEELRALVRQAGFTVKTVTVMGDKPKALYLRAVKDVPLGKTPINH